MQFNDTSGLTGLIQQCEFWTGLGTAGISGDATLLKIFTANINKAYHRRVAQILGYMDEWDFDDPNIGDTGFMKTYDLTAGTQYIDLTLGSKILKVKRVEVKLDGSTWEKAEPMDINELSSATDSVTIAGMFSTSAPKYDQHGRYIFFYPIPAVTVSGGAKLWVAREVDEFTTADTTQEPGFDKPFHELLALDASLDWGMSKRLDNRAEIASKAIALSTDMELFYGKKNEDRQITAKALEETYD
jgi:hypothetical protein